MDQEDGIYLIVVSVSGGLIGKWNEENPTREVKLRYKIAEVNDVFGDVNNLVDECKLNKVLRITFIVANAKCREASY